MSDKIQQEVDFLLAKFVIPSIADRYDAVFAISAWARNREADIEQRAWSEGAQAGHDARYPALEAELAALKAEIDDIKQVQFPKRIESVTAALRKEVEQLKLKSNCIDWPSQMCELEICGYAGAIRNCKVKGVKDETHELPRPKG